MLILFPRFLLLLLVELGERKQSSEEVSPQKNLRRNTEFTGRLSNWQQREKNELALKKQKRNKGKLLKKFRKSSNKRATTRREELQPLPPLERSTISKSNKQEFLQFHRKYPRKWRNLVVNLIRDEVGRRRVLQLLSVLPLRLSVSLPEDLQRRKRRKKRTASVSRFLTVK